MIKVGPYKRLRELPGIGAATEHDLILLGYRRPEDLIGAKPEQDYERWQRLTGIKERCMLYVLRCVVYAVETPAARRDPKLLRWWAWKDEAVRRRQEIPANQRGKQRSGMTKWERESSKFDKKQEHHG